jgi:hypothetical protein
MDGKLQISLRNSRNLSTLFLPTLDQVLILDDFSKHWDCQRNVNTKQLADVLRSTNLRQHVQERTHRHGHILDLVISRDYHNLIKGVSGSSMLSDYFHINIDASVQKQSVSAKVISYRQLFIKSINKELLFLVCLSILWHWIKQIMLIIWWISIIVY